MLEGLVERVGGDADVEALALGLGLHLLDEEARGHAGVAGEQDILHCDPLSEDVHRAITVTLG